MKLNLKEFFNIGNKAPVAEDDNTGLTMPVGNDEEMFGEYASFINGNVVVKDLVFVETKESLSDIIAKLTNEVANLRMEVAKLKSQTQTQPIYK